MNIKKTILSLLFTALSFPAISMEAPLYSKKNDGSKVLIPTSFLAMSAGAREKLQAKREARQAAIEERAGVIFTPEVISAQIDTEEICGDNSPAAVAQYPASPRGILKTSESYSPRVKKD